MRRGTMRPAMRDPSQPANQTHVDETVAALVRLDTWLRDELAILRNQPPVRATHMTRRMADASLGISTHSAQLLRRILAPTCHQQQHRRLPALTVNAAIARWQAAIIGSTDRMLEEVAIHAGVELLKALKAWLDDARWHQATRRTGVAWKHPESRVTTALIGLSMTPEQEHRENAAPRKVQIAAGPPGRGRGTDQPAAAAQGRMLLPLAGGAEASSRRGANARLMSGKTGPHESSIQEPVPAKMAS